MTLLEGLGKGQAGECLLEYDREPDEREALPVHDLQAEIDELRSVFIAYSLEAFYGATSPAANCPKNMIVRAEVLLIARINFVAKSGFCPDLLADHAGPNVCNRFAEVPANSLSKIHKKRKGLNRNARAFQGRLQ